MSVCPLGWSTVPPTQLFPVKQREPAPPGPHSLTELLPDLRKLGGLLRGLREGHVDVLGCRAPGVSVSRTM